MKITPFYLNRNMNQNKIQNFEGLWGKTSRNSDFDQALGIPKVEEVCYYYPFKNETPDQIHEVVSKNTEAYIDESEEIPKYKIKDCKVCTTFPFEEIHYLSYAMMPSKSKLSNKIKIIHSYVKDKYTTNKYGPEQTSAVNEEVVKRLNMRG